MVKHKTTAAGEQEIIERIRRRVALPPRSGLVLGIGDDCAIFRPRGAREDLLFTTDMIIEGVHFRRETHGAGDVGWKARSPGATWDQALHGGEDYELLFTAPARARVPRDFEGVPLTRIGAMRPGRPGAVELEGAPLEPLGYDHFRATVE